MKIYIDDYHPKELLKKMDKLDEYFKKQYNYIELVSPSSGLFHIENKKVYKLKAIDKPIAKLDKYYKENICYSIIVYMRKNKYIHKCHMTIRVLLGLRFIIVTELILKYI